MCEVYATCAYCRLFATSSQSWCAVPRECGTCWLYIYNSYLLTLPPIATPLEFSHQFYNCFDPKYRSFLKRSLCPSQVRAGYLSCPSKFFQSFVAIESIYLVYAQAHAERLLLCSTHALKSQCKSSLISICGKVTMTAFERMSWVCKHLWVSGIQLGSLR